MSCFGSESHLLTFQCLKFTKLLKKIIYYFTYLFSSGGIAIMRTSLEKPHWKKAHIQIDEIDTKPVLLKNAKEIVKYIVQQRKFCGA